MSALYRLLSVLTVAALLMGATSPGDLPAPHAPAQEILEATTVDAPTYLPAVTQQAAAGVTTAGSSAPHSPDQTLIVPTNNRAALSLTASGDRLLYHFTASEFCDPANIDTQHIIMRFAVAGGQDPIWTGCEPYSPGRLTAGSTNVFFANYVDGDDDAILRVPIDGGEITRVGAANFVITDEPDPPRSTLSHAAPGNLVSEGDYLYFGDWDGIKRMAKSSGAVSLLAEGHLNRMLVVDEAHVYWIESRLDDAIYRVTKELGGVVETVVAADEVDHPVAFAVDATHIYWTESGGVARSTRKNDPGAAILDYGIRSEAIAGPITVDDTYVYWMDEQRLRRAPKAGGRVEALAVNVRGTRGLQIVGTDLVWSGEAVHGSTFEYGLWRLPIVSAEMPVEFTITGIEVTQSIQNMANDVPLIEDKPTFVRVYARSDVRYTGVMAQLRGYRGGVELAGSPLAPLGPVTVNPAGGHRANAEDSFRFLLPESWLNGTVRFVAEVNPAGSPAEVTETDRSDNTDEVTLSFVPQSPLCIWMAPIWTEPENFVYGDPRYDEMMHDVEAAFPIAEVTYRVWPSYVTNHGSPFRIAEPAGAESARLFGSQILAVLNEYGLASEPIPGCTVDQTYAFGMVHPALLDNVGGAGQAYKPGHEAYGTMQLNLDWQYAAFGERMGYCTWDWYPPPGWAIMAEELGHNLDRSHIDCGEVATDTFDTDFPYEEPCDLGPVNPDSYYGFHPLRQTVIDPGASADFMGYAERSPDGYCPIRGGGGERIWPSPKPEWVSDYTYRGLYDAIGGGGLAQSAAAPQTQLAGESLWVSGIISTSSPAGVQQLTVSRLPAGLYNDDVVTQYKSRVRTNASGAYTLTLLDGSDTALETLRFDLPVVMDGGEGQQPFFAVVSYDTDTARITLAQGSTLLADVPVSPAAPAVTVHSPNGGENITDHLRVAWSGSDPDGDALRYTVQYSADNGATWQVLALAIPETVLELDDLSLLPGSNRALVRVVANDGVNTASDKSNATFRVATKPPKATIIQPLDGAVFPPGTQVVARGSGYDAEDGVLNSGALHWSVEGVPAGTGKEVAVGPFAPGAYELTLRVVDTEQTSVETSVTFFVREALCAEDTGALDILFLLDTSLAAAPHARLACRAIGELVADFQELGWVVDHEVLGIAGTRACATETAQSRAEAGSIDHTADWGPAIEQMAARHPWVEGAARLIIPIINQGPQDGNPVEVPGADLDSADAALAAALENHVVIAPALMPIGPKQAGVQIRKLAGYLATGTGGRVIEWGESIATFVAALGQELPDTTCTPVIDQVNAPARVRPDTVIAVFGEHFAWGTRVYVGGMLARDIALRPDGTQLTFKLPPGLAPGATYDLLVERPDVGRAVLANGLTLAPAEVEQPLFVPSLQS